MFLTRLSSLRKQGSSDSGNVYHLTEAPLSTKSNYQDSFIILSGADESKFDRLRENRALEKRIFFCGVTYGIGFTLIGGSLIKVIKNVVLDGDDTSGFKTRESLSVAGGLALILLATYTVCKLPKPPSGPHLGPPSGGGGGGGGHPHPIDFDLAMPVPRTPGPDAVADEVERKKAAAASAIALIGGGYTLYKLIRAVAFGVALTPPVGVVSLALP